MPSPDKRHVEESENRIGDPCLRNPARRGLILQAMLISYSKIVTNGVRARLSLSAAVVGLHTHAVGRVTLGSLVKGSQMDDLVAWGASSPSTAREVLGARDAWGAWAVAD